jgi:hypothetical protein
MAVIDRFKRVSFNGKTGNIIERENKSRKKLRRNEYKPVKAGDLV